MTDVRVTREYVEDVRFGGASDTRVTRQYIEVVRGITLTDPSPNITGIGSGCPGDSVTITGSFFGGSGDVDVTDSDNVTYAATISSWSDTSITFVIPAASKLGSAVVTVTRPDAQFDTTPLTIFACVPQSNAVPDPIGERLGCGDYRVFLQNVGGGVVLAELIWHQLSFSRRLDDMSDARVEIAAEQDADCLTYLSDLEPFDYELAIWRDGIEVWVGPITEPIFTYEGASIVARDLFQWFERRLLLTDRTFTSTDLATIAQTYANDALALDPTPNIAVTITPSGVLGTRVVTASLLRRAADELRELARTGLDFTALGRTILFGGEEIGTPTLPTLIDGFFEVDPLRLAGLARCNNPFVLGTSGGGVNSPTVGEAGGLDTPLLQQTYSEPAILDVDSADHAARTRYELLNRSPVVITGRLLEDAPISFNRLVPGARSGVAQQVGFRAVNTTARLLSVDVSAQAADDGNTEDVRLTLEPLGTVES